MCWEFLWPAGCMVRLQESEGTFTLTTLARTDLAGGGPEGTKHRAGRQRGWGWGGFN